MANHTSPKRKASSSNLPRDARKHCCKPFLVVCSVFVLLLPFPAPGPGLFLGLVAAIYKEAGKQELYLKQRPEELEKLVEIAGYRDVLNLIHENFDAIPITQNYILQFHKILYSHMNNPMAGRIKSVQNYISATYPDGHAETLFTPLPPYETPETLDRICEEYNRVIGNMEVEPLIVIPLFIHDFLCIHPFNDGNGRMSRLLTTLLLYRSGFYVGKYIPWRPRFRKTRTFIMMFCGKHSSGGTMARKMRCPSSI